MDSFVFGEVERGQGDMIERWHKNSDRVGSSGDHLNLVWTALSVGLIALASLGFSSLRHQADRHSLAITNRAVAPEGSYDQAKAIILFIGDGMGEAQRTAATWYQFGPDGSLYMDSMASAGWSETASKDNLITDSAAGATALATGVRTNNGFVSLDPDLNSLKTILERAQAHGWATGLVTTTQISHATPAAFAAHVSDRNQMREIASQLLAAEVEVLLGGGEDEFLPTGSIGCYPQPGERSDGRDLIAEFIAAGYVYACDGPSFEAIEPGTTSRLLGLFSDEGMTRPFSPALAEMTEKAIQILAQDPDGFFLMVEGGQIDWAGHANDAQNVIGDVLSLDEAVSVGQTYAALNPETLVIVTADHETGGMSVTLSSSGVESEDGPFQMPDGTPYYVNWATDGHTGADVPIMAQGPMAELLWGTFRNTTIHNVMHGALAGVTFTDVPPNYWSWRYVETLADSAITSGCGLERYCPEGIVTRAQMAVFLERGMRGAEYIWPAATGAVFADVPSDHWAAAWIEQLYADGVTSGCLADPVMYCPEEAVSRAQMAVFLERAMHWPDFYSPPTGSGTLFDDVSGVDWAGDWIEQLYADGVTSGCDLDPLMYCPERAVKRSEMAVFIAKAFGLPVP